ncbi:cystine/glutamate transporter-like isoform X2 [Apostichopus japonicus]|uniref:cystine/glutamate transporter-like isoform X2 n=1 Tax=Stichopus japonicus TaxID=307972 RepID=UPI003AB85BD1
MKTSEPISDDSKVFLKRIIGIVPCIGFITGIVIGTGIFVSPTGILRGVNGSVGLAFIIWIVCAVLSLIGGLCYTELATMFSKSGGEFTYIKEAFGPTLAYLRVWTVLMILSPADMAIQALTVATYLTTPFLGQCTEAPYWSVRLIALCVFSLIIFVNSTSVPLTSHLQVLMTAAKTVGLLIIIITGFVNLLQGNTSNFDQPFQVKDFDFNLLPSAFYAGMFAYSGWDNITCITEEIKKPEKTITKAMIISLVLVTVIYLLTNVAYLTAMTPSDILGSDVVAADFAEATLGQFSWMIWLFVALSAAGSLNGGAFARGRMYFVASREGLLPEVISMVHIGWKTPLPSMAFSLPLTVIMLLSGNLWELLTFSSFIDTAFIVVTLCAIPYFRWKRPDQPRPFKVPLVFCFIFIVVSLFILIMTFYTDFLQAFIGVGVTLFGLIFYYFGVQWKTKPIALKRTIKNSNDFLQKLFMSIPQEVKTY